MIRGGTRWSSVAATTSVFRHAFHPALSQPFYFVVGRHSFHSSVFVALKPPAPREVPHRAPSFVPDALPHQHQHEQPPPPPQQQQQQEKEHKQQPDEPSTKQPPRNAIFDFEVIETSKTCPQQTTHFEFTSTTNLAHGPLLDKSTFFRGKGQQGSSELVFKYKLIFHTPVTLHSITLQGTAFASSNLLVHDANQNLIAKSQAHQSLSPISSTTLSSISTKVEKRGVVFYLSEVNDSKDLRYRTSLRLEASPAPDIDIPIDCVSGDPLKFAKLVVPLHFENKTLETICSRRMLPLRLFEAVKVKFLESLELLSTQDLERIQRCANYEQRNEVLVWILFRFVLREFSTAIAEHDEEIRRSNMTQPHTMYPLARQMTRRVVYHYGPTNSGKTHHALNALKAASTGVYCGPLRLLALEIFDRLNAENVKCNLLTGQEKRDVDGSQHTSSTVEMVNISKRYEVAVVDEIQMISDRERGAAWTRAVLGLPAEEIHVCGDASALEMVRGLCQLTGDTFEMREYSRLVPLEVEADALTSYANLNSGDCVVAFSRRDIYAIKNWIERTLKKKCCVVYGSLPPETRAQQARQFNDPNSGYHILVASNAIGMGLNLNIRRVIFHELEKFDGTQVSPLTTSEIKQIAGRAGRASSKYNTGYATCLHPEDMTNLREALLAPLHTSAACGLFPSFEQIEFFAENLPDCSLPELLNRFTSVAKLDGAYFLSNYESTLAVATVLEECAPNLTLAQKFTLCMAPVSKDPFVEKLFRRWMNQLSRAEVVLLDNETTIAESPETSTSSSSSASSSSPSGNPRDPTQRQGFRVFLAQRRLEQLEAIGRALDLYLWLAMRFADLFVDLQLATARRDEACATITELLEKISDFSMRRRFVSPSTAPPLPHQLHHTHTHTRHVHPQPQGQQPTKDLTEKAHNLFSRLNAQVVDASSAVSEPREGASAFVRQGSRNGNRQEQKPVSVVQSLDAILSKHAAQAATSSSSSSSSTNTSTGPTQPKPIRPPRSHSAPPQSFQSPQQHRPFQPRTSSPSPSPSPTTPQKKFARDIPDNYYNPNLAPSKWTQQTTTTTNTTTQTPSQTNTNNAFSGTNKPNRMSSTGGPRPRDHRSHTSPHSHLRAHSADARPYSKEPQTQSQTPGSSTSPSSPSPPPSPSPSPSSPAVPFTTNSPTQK